MLLLSNAGVHQHELGGHGNRAFTSGGVDTAVAVACSGSDTSSSTASARSGSMVIALGRIREALTVPRLRILLPCRCYADLNPV